MFLYISLPLTFFSSSSSTFLIVSLKSFWSNFFADAFGDFSVPLLSRYFFHFVPSTSSSTSLNFLRIFLFTNVRGFRLNLAVLRLHSVNQIPTNLCPFTFYCSLPLPPSFPPQLFFLVLPSPQQYPFFSLFLSCL